MRWLLMGLLILAGIWNADSAWAECRVLSSPETYTPGQVVRDVCDIHGTRTTGFANAAGNATVDANGNMPVTQGTLTAGEDLTATGAYAGGVVVVETRYLNTGTKSADFQVKATPGFVHNLVCVGADASATGGSIIVYDNTAESGTALYTFTVVAANNYSLNAIVFPIDAVAATGIYLGYTTTADVNCNVSYR
jgi:hypothetical protein